MKDLGARGVGLAAIFMLSITSAYACQESCRSLEMRAGRITLADREGRPVANARLIIREAQDQGHLGQRMLCGKAIGEVVHTLTTNRKGQFTLKSRSEAFYWVSYDDAEAGESFLIQLKEKPETDFREIRLQSWGGLCYLVDIEHNATRPSGWKNPIYIKQRETNATP